MGGEKRYAVPLFCGREGSPPRGRGKVYRTGKQSVRAGITPAWAGKSSFRRHIDRASEDHPRVGGEK